ncbi:MAG TPA: hypothetical protein VEQ35_04115 [Beijerinckia sp.]|jgi:hypothetical protein|nr:hypothetical protein [Beijerinckia sp.]
MPPEPTADENAREALKLNPFPPSTWVSVADDGIVISTGYSEALNRLLRWVPKAKWRPDRRCWLVPFSGAEAVRAVLPEINRLADATQELADVEERHRSGEKPPLDHLVEAAKLAFGENWQSGLAGVPGQSKKPLDWAESGAKLEPGDAVFPELIRRMRRQAADLITGADRLEEWLAEAKRKAGQP